MVDDVDVDRPALPPSTSSSATSSGVIMGDGGTRSSCHRHGSILKPERFQVAGQSVSVGSTTSEGVPDDAAEPAGSGACLREAARIVVECHYDNHEDGHQQVADTDEDPQTNTLAPHYTDTRRGEARQTAYPAQTTKAWEETICPFVSLQCSSVGANTASARRHAVAAMPHIRSSPPRSTCRSPCESDERDGFAVTRSTFGQGRAGHEPESISGKAPR